MAKRGEEVKTKKTNEDPLSLPEVVLKKQNEVARLRELLNRAIEALENLNSGQAFVKPQVLREELARLAPAPEEPISTPADLNQQFKENTLSLNEWRELGQDEVIQEGDEYCRHSPLIWRQIELHNTMVKQWPMTMYKFRTRRPLPKQEEMPRDIDVLIDTIAFRGERKGEGVFFCIADSIRYLRDEIQKLKEAQ